MKKNIIFIIIFILIISLFWFISSPKEYKVLKIVDGDTFYIDINSNNKIEKNERFRVNGIDTFETKTGQKLNNQAKSINISDKDALKLGFLAKKFAKENLSNKYIKIKYSAQTRKDKYNRGLISIYYDCDENNQCKSYEKEILKEGLAVVYPFSNLKDELIKYEDINKIKENIKK